MEDHAARTNATRSKTLQLHSGLRHFAASTTPASLTTVRDMKLAAIAFLACAACSGTWGEQHRTTIAVMNASTGTMAAVGMALDWCGTRHAAETRTDEWEMGMPTTQVIGTSPSPHAVDAYFAIGTVILAAAARAVPERYRWVAYSAVSGFEIVAVHNNLSTTRCGPLGTAW